MTMASLTSIGIGTWNSSEQLEHAPLSRFTLASDASGAFSCSNSGISLVGGTNCSGSSIPEEEGFDDDCGSIKSSTSLVTDGFDAVWGSSSKNNAAASFAA